MVQFGELLNNLKKKKSLTLFVICVAAQVQVHICICFGAVLRSSPSGASHNSKGAISHLCQITGSYGISYSGFAPGPTENEGTYEVVFISSSQPST